MAPAIEPSSTQGNHPFDENIPAASIIDNKTLKAITFDLAGYWIAIPISYVVKVINAPPGQISQANGVGLVHLSNYAITVVDLHQRLNLGQSNIDSQNQKFLIVIRIGNSDLCSVPVSEPPTLLDIPLAEIRQLPNSYRRSHPLGIASHVAMVSYKEDEDQEEETLEVFVLDMKQVFEGQ
jgi:purine-binding chemotaxis protein CheW